MKTIVITFSMLVLVGGLCFVGCEGTDAPECDGDGGETGCDPGYYCAIDNTCQQDCTEDDHCNGGQVCNEFGGCVDPQDGGM